MADTLDLLTPAEALSAVQQEQLSGDLADELTRLVTTVSRQIVARCGPVVHTTITNELHGGGSIVIRLDHRPVSSVTTVYERNGTSQSTIVAENWAAPTGDDYLLDPSAGCLYRRSGGGDYRWVPGRKNISVTYVAGRFANTAAVSAQYKAAASIALKHVWSQYRGLGSPTFGGIEPGVVTPWMLPKAALDILADQLLAPAIA